MDPLGTVKKHDVCELENPLDWSSLDPTPTPTQTIRSRSIQIFFSQTPKVFSPKCCGVNEVSGLNMP